MGKDEKKRVRQGVIELQFLDGVFIGDSDGRVIEHPEFYTREIRTLRRLNWSLSRKQPGSRNRRKAKYRLAKWHEHIANKRAYFLWHIARFYAANYERIVVPKLPLSRMVHYAIESKKARKLCDAAYASFVQKLRHKCNEFGREFVERKDDELWRKEIEKCTEVARMERVRKMVYKGRKIIKSGNREALASLAEAFEQVRTLRI
jgi:IS605 OrfB family transposase